VKPNHHLAGKGETHLLNLSDMPNYISVSPKESTPISPKVWIRIQKNRKRHGSSRHEHRIILSEVSVAHTQVRAILEVRDASGFDWLTGLVFRWVIKGVTGPYSRAGYGHHISCANRDGFWYG
jgi:hypothetical protein